jgi:NnrS protein
LRLVQLELFARFCRWRSLFLCIDGRRSATRRRSGARPAGVSRPFFLETKAVTANRITGAALIVAAIFQVVRLVRWAGDRTVSDRLVLVLHVGYAFVPLGFVLVGLSILDPAAVPATAGIHAWTAGAIGLMTRAVMTRASLGHTGQPLVAGPGTQTIYAHALIAAVLRRFQRLDAGGGTGGDGLGRSFRRLCPALRTLADTRSADLVQPRLAKRPAAGSSRQQKSQGNLEPCTLRAHKR